MAKKTVLFDEHQHASAKIVEFAGWLMPVEYEGLRHEHNWVRSEVGIFDVSHMGEIRVQGPDALQTLEWITTNSVAKLKSGQAQYSLFPNGKGGVVDDLIVYCLKPGEDYLLCVNASNIQKDFDFMIENNRGASITNESEHWAQIAVQGPKAVALVSHVFDFDAALISKFHFAPRAFEGVSCLLARTGYTGEDGFEIFVPTGEAVSLWRRFQQGGAKPIGLGARDTLRTEMKYSLYGHEIDDDTNPYEAGLGWVIKPRQKDFLGRSDLEAAARTKKLVGFKMKDRAIARHGYSVWSTTGEPIGRVTSGTPSPTLQENIGIGYVDMAFCEVGTEICVDIRGRRLRAEIVSTPFVKQTSLQSKESS